MRIISTLTSLVGLGLLSAYASPAVAAPNCTDDFFVSPPSCVSQDQAAAECAFEALYETLTDPRIFTITLRLETGDGPFADTEGAVWVRLDGAQKIYLNSPRDDFEHGDSQRFTLLGTGVEKLSDIERLEIGNDSSDHWAMSGVALSLNGITVFETAPDFEHVVGSGGSRWWAPVDMNLAGQRADITLLPNSLNARKALETILGNLFHSAPGSTDWNLGHRDSDGVFEFTIDPADDAHAMFSGYVVTRDEGADIFADLSGEIRVSCEDGVFALAPSNLGLDITSVDVHGYWEDLFSTFGDPEAAAQNVVNGLLAEVNEDLDEAQIQIEIGPILDDLDLDLTDFERAFLLNALCPQPRFSGPDLRFNWPEPLAIASFRMELADVPEPIVCIEPIDPPPFDPSVWVPEPDANPFGDVELHPNLVVDSIIDLGDETLEVTVRNAGFGDSAQTWIDVFFERQTPPAVGEYGDVYASVPALDHGESHIAIVDKLGSGWVDAIVDTTQSVEESDEDDNRLEALIW